MSDLPLFDPYKALEEIRRRAGKKGSPGLSQQSAKAKTQSEQQVDLTFADFVTFAGGGMHAVSRSPA